MNSISRQEAKIDPAKNCVLRWICVCVWCHCVWMEWLGWGGSWTIWFWQPKVGNMPSVQYIQCKVCAIKIFVSTMCCDYLDGKRLLAVTNLQRITAWQSGDKVGDLLRSETFSSWRDRYFFFPQGLVETKSLKEGEYWSHTQLPMNVTLLCVCAACVNRQLFAMKLATESWRPGVSG